MSFSAATRSALLIAKKDLAIEAKTKDITVATSYFAGLVTVISALSFYMDTSSAAKIAPGVLWVATAFSGLMTVTRSWAREREMNAMRALLMAPISRASIFFGKSLSSIVFLLIIECVLVPLVGLFFHVDISVLPAVAVFVLLGVVGFAFAGTLFGTLSVRSSARDLTLSVVIFPLITPALLGGVAACRELFHGAPLADLQGWGQILLAYDLMMAIAGWLLFDLLVSE